MRIKSFLFSLILGYFFLFSSNNSYAFDYSVVNNTSWKVAEFVNGVRGGFHHAPWIFSPDGFVRAPGFWVATWHHKKGNTINVSIIVNGKVADNFDVAFMNTRTFIAYKNGRTYRWGERKN